MDATHHAERRTITYSLLTGTALLISICQASLPTCTLWCLYLPKGLPAQALQQCASV